MLKVELHAHSGDDPIDRIPYSTRELIDRAAQLGYDALAITLHQRQLELCDHVGYAAERGVTLIRGVEREVEGRHVLLLNFSDAAESVSTFEDLAALRSRERGLVIAPHPFFPTGCCLREDLVVHSELFDAVEWSAMFTRQLNCNLAAQRFATAYGKPMVGNGDVHRLHQLGTCYSLVDAERDPTAICDAVRSGRVEVSAEPLSLLNAVTTVGNMLASDIVARLHPPRPHREPASRQAV